MRSAGAVRPWLIVAALALTGAPTPTAAAPSARPTREDVAMAFMAAAGARDHQAVLQVLASDVVIRFPSAQEAGGVGEARGKPYVLGYLDGLVDSEPVARRVVAINRAATRFQTYDRNARPRHSIDIEVRNHRVIAVTVGAAATPGG
jgi:hypothetical protein